MYQMYNSAYSAVCIILCGTCVTHMMCITAYVSLVLNISRAESFIFIFILSIKCVEILVGNS